MFTRSLRFAKLSCVDAIEISEAESKRDAPTIQASEKDSRPSPSGIARPLEDFDHSLYIKFRTELTEKGITAFEMDSIPLELVAAAITSAEPNQSLLGLYIEKTIQSGTAKERRRLFNILAKFDVFGGAYPNKTENLMAQIYNLTRQTSTSISDWFRPESFYQTMMRRKIEVDLQTKSFISTIENLGIQNTPITRIFRHGKGL